MERQLHCTNSNSNEFCKAHIKKTGALQKLHAALALSNPAYKPPGFTITLLSWVSGTTIVARSKLKQFARSSASTISRLQHLHHLSRSAKIGGQNSRASVNISWPIQRQTCGCITDPCKNLNPISTLTSVAMPSRVVAHRCSKKRHNAL